MSNWTLGDTHGGVGNFRNGLDNWIWAMQGYNTSSPVINGVEQPAFRMGFFRFRLSQDDDPVVEKLEFIRSHKQQYVGAGYLRRRVDLWFDGEPEPQCVYADRQPLL